MAKTKTRTKNKQATVVTREDEVRERIKEIADGTERGFVTLSVLLSEAYHGRFYSQWGFDEFAAYADSECATGYRKAMQLIKTIDKMMNLGVPIERAEEIGWTKMRELIKIMNAENMEDLLNEFGDKTYREITDHIKIIRQADLDGAGAPIQHKLTIVLGEDTNAIVTEALTMAKELINTDSNALGLAMVCQDWMAAQDEVPQSVSIEHIVGYVKKIFGVDMVVAGGAKEEAKPAKKEEKVPAKKGKAKGKAKAPAKEPEKKPEAEKADTTIDDILGV